MDKPNLSRHLPDMTPKTPRSPPNGSRVVEVLAFPSVQLLDVTGPVQVFASANNFMVAAGNAPPYAVRVVAHGSPS
ncbi:MAG: GlxA family transcriptional regulator, partial [Bradyrhizobium sp.]|nr:GlxA family transcriptional regulator [Bradyrhizobium sp.]